MNNTIILSKSAILLLLAEIDVPATSYAPAMRLPLWSVLAVLAKYGFDIVIPEMVSYDTGNILRGGWTLRKYFRNSRPAENVYGKASDFLTKGLSDKRLDLGLGEFSGPFLKILSPDKQDASPSSVFIRDLNAIHESALPDGKKNSLIMELQRKSYDPRMGAEAFLNLAVAMSGQLNKVFCLTDDLDLLCSTRDLCEKNDRIQGMTVPDLFKTISDAHAEILSESGFAGVSFENILNAIKEHVDNEQRVRIPLLRARVLYRYSLSEVLHSLAATPSPVSTFVDVKLQQHVAKTAPAKPTGLDKFKQRYGSWSAASLLNKQLG